MPTTRKSATARANGAKSLGPKTAATRAISARNNLSHGLTSWSTLVLQSESQEEFDKVLAYYTSAFAPATDAEVEFVTEMVAARWRLRRIWSIETALIDAEMDRQRPQVSREFTRCDEGVQIALAFRTLCDESRSLQLASRYESRLRRIFDRAFANLQTLQQARKAAEEKECDSNPPGTQLQQPQPVPDPPESSTTALAKPGTQTSPEPKVIPIRVDSRAGLQPHSSKDPAPQAASNPNTRSPGSNSSHINP